MSQARRRRGPEWLGPPWGHDRRGGGDDARPRARVAHTPRARREAARGVTERGQRQEVLARHRRTTAYAVRASGRPYAAPLATPCHEARILSQLFSPAKTRGCARQKWRSK